jgi:opacity protein-like surface antigen
MAGSRIAVLAILVLIALALAQTSHAQFARHHIGIEAGYFKAASSDLKSGDVDFTNGILLGVHYRFSMNELLDLAADLRNWSSSQSFGAATATVNTSFFGGGVRVNVPGKAARPYIQANFYAVTEQVSAEYENYRFESDIGGTAFGFGVNGGIDVDVTDLISIPIEVMYLFGEPGDDVSGIGFALGVNFNFGRAKAAE